MSNILVIVSSIHKNMELAQTVKKELEEQGAFAEILDLVRLDLPLYHQLAEEKGIPSKVLELSEQISKSRALFFVTPEYNGSLPPVLNNTIAWISRASPDWRAAFNGKVAALASHSGSGGINVLRTLAHQLSYIGVNLVGRQVTTTYQKPLDPEALTAVVSHLLKLAPA